MNKKKKKRPKHPSFPLIVEIGVKKESLDKALDEVVPTLLGNIDFKYSVALKKVRLGQDTWETWGKWFVELKTALEYYMKNKDVFHPVIFSTVMIYCYAKNRNEILSQYIKSSVGGMGRKKMLKKSGVLMRDVILGDKEMPERDKQFMAQKVLDNLEELKNGCHEKVSGRKVVTKVIDQRSIDQNEQSTGV